MNILCLLATLYCPENAVLRLSASKPCQERIVDDCLEIIVFLTSESGNIVWHDDALEEKAEELVECLRKQVGGIQREYDD